MLCADQWAKLSHPQVEKEWKEFVSLKQNVAVRVLSQYLGQRAAQAKVESTLASEQSKQDKLIKLWVMCMKLKMRIHRLEAELRGVEDQRKDPVQLLIGQLHAARLEHKKLFDRQNEESIRLQNRIRSSLEVGWTMHRYTLCQGYSYCCL